ncbi:MAG TPA: vanadium-dependent haloperoxidase [Verrucomicrobiae bacterium]
MNRSTAASSNSVARVWDERALAAIRVDTPHPPAQARNLFTFSVCMYDAWAAYDTNGAMGFVYHQKHTSTNIAAARREAISYAVWRMMKERHVYSKTASQTLAADDTQLTALGYSTANPTRDTSTPAGVGNSVYDAVSAWFMNDGANQSGGTPYPTTNAPIAYPDYPTNQGGYIYMNPQLAVALEGIDDGFGNTVVDINHWQRLQIVNAIDQNGFPAGPIQSYLGAQWLKVRPYQMARIDPTLPWVDPGPPPLFGTATHSRFVSEIVEVIRASSQLTPDDGALIDISPAAYGNNSDENYGGIFPNVYDGHGYTSNPVTGQPYAHNFVRRGDYARVLAEFWADGPNSETPPGHWNVVANQVADSPLLVKKIGGVGPVVDDLEWDVKVYLAVNAAVHEAACACWAVKRYYDAWRPISAVRYLGGLGQSSNPALPSYNTNGLPLITNLIELVTSTSAASGRHAGLMPGKIAVLAWPGVPSDPIHQHSGVTWIHADTWVPYQRTNFVTPAFPGYISGHTTFSRAAAEVMTAVTGSKFFPGGLASYTYYPTNNSLGSTLGFEQGPSQTLTMQWASYYDAADAAGISRVWGGIHAPVDNLRSVGMAAGKGVWETARKYFDGSITSTPINLTITKLNSGKTEVRFNTLRCMYYKLQGSTNLNQAMTDFAGPPVVAYDSSMAYTNQTSGTGAYFRAVRSTTP